MDARNDRAEALDTLLSTHGAAMSGWQVQALFLGAHTSTNMRLGPHHLLDRILGDDAQLEDADDLRKVVGALGVLWNELAQWQRSGVRLSPFLLPEEPTLEHIRALAERRHEELVWFIRGIDAGGDDPAEFGAAGDELFTRLAEATAFFQRYAELASDDARAPESRDSLREAGRALGDLTRTAEGIIADLLEVGRTVRAEAIRAFNELSRRGRTDDGARVGARKVGRNEPCPCGSGKKWKKCCGGARASEH